MPRSRRFTEPLALCALAALGCKGSSSSNNPSPPGQVVTQPVPQQPAGQPVPPGRGARVFVDISQSIQGFTSPTSSALETLHSQVIEASLSAMQLNNPFQRCTVDENVHCEAPVTAQQLRNPAIYRGTNSALHLALRRPPRAPRADQQLPDPLDPYNVTMLVTDGFQSTASAFQPNATSDVACTAGADPSCLAALLRARVDEGYGVWVGRLVMGFDGRYFAERRLDASMTARTLAHVETLNRDPAWNGVRFSATIPRNTGDSGAFRWVGARPLLIFVLTRDIARGRALVAEMERRLRVERITKRASPEDVAFAEWAPFEGLSGQVLSARRNENGGSADTVYVERPARTPQTGFTIPTRCDIRGKARIRMDGAIQLGSLPPPRFANVALGWRMISRPSNELLVPREAIAAQQGPFVAFTGIDCTVIPQGEFTYVMGLHAQWTVDPAALAREWFSTESAATSYEEPEKVFGLADLARAVITAGVQREGFLDRVTLRVRRE